MSRATQVLCDGCGKQRQETNHWWQVGIKKRRDGERFIFALIVAAPDATLDSSWREFDFCGQDCALRFISEQMGKVNG